MRRWLQLVLLACLSSVHAAGAQEAPRSADDHDEMSSLEKLAKDYVAGHVEARLAQAKEMVLVVPHWEHSDHSRTDLFVVNNFRHPIEAELTVSDSEGRVVWLEILTIEPASHLEVAMSTQVSDALGTSSGGSAKLRYSGDADMLQVWGVLHASGGAVEIVSQNVSTSNETRRVSFWDARPFRVSGGLGAEYVLANGGDQSLRYRITEHGPGRGVASQNKATVGTLAPGQRRTWTPSSTGRSHGGIEVDYQGAPGSLAMVGLMRGRSFLGALPVSTPEIQQLGGVWQSIRLPFLGEMEDGLAQAAVSLFNTTSEPRDVGVRTVDTLSGRETAVETVKLQPGEVRSVRIDRLVAKAPATHLSRVVVAGAQGILVGGLAWNYSSGATDEIALFPREKAHGTGSYPLPDPSVRPVTTTLVNVGDEDTRIVGQMSWDSGSYALGPFTIAAGGSRTLDFERIVAEAEPDILGRRPSPSFLAGHFHWTVQGGSTSVLARTEVKTPAGDSFGFNCFGCCLEQSYGDLLPGQANFLSGTGAPFEGVEFIESCTGTMGPYSPYNPTWNFSSPFSWTGTNVSASSPAIQSLWFTATGHWTAVSTCTEREFMIMDTGSARSIKVSILDVDLPTGTIRVKLEPNSASGILKVRLSNPSQRVLTSNSSYSGGTHTFDFGNLSTYSAGQEFKQVIAEWTVNGKTITATKNYHFRALGTFNHTRYNTPTQSFCAGATTPFCYFTGTCASVQSCTSYSAAQAPLIWLDEVYENGSGYHSTLGFISREWFCSSPQGCGSYRLRKVPQPCPYCQGVALTPGYSVAVHPSRTDLPCGATLFVDGVGVVSVNDHGSLPSSNQLDHYAGTSGCNRTAGTIGFRPTFHIY